MFKIKENIGGICMGLFVIAFFIVLFYSMLQQDKNYEAQQKELLQEVRIAADFKHELRVLTTMTHEHGEMSGSYFLIIGSMHGEYSKDTLIRFVWKDENGDFNTTDLSYGNVKFHIDDSIETPYLKFPLVEDGWGIYINTKQCTIYLNSKQFPTMPIDAGKLF